MNIFGAGEMMAQNQVLHNAEEQTNEVHPEVPSSDDNVEDLEHG